MYSTCLHCHRSLGRNDAIEHFPIGRRLAFDAEKGRLWAVCAHCSRWNLTPIEERWEAVEESERLFRATNLRAQTDNVGLARVGDGTELIRIGTPLRPEFAAWRYGAVLHRRFARRTTAVAGAGVVAIGGGTYLLAGSAALAAQLAAVAAAGPVLLLPFLPLAIGALGFRGRLVATRIVGDDGRVLRVVRAGLDHSRILGGPNVPLRLHLQHTMGQIDLTGDRAARALSILLAQINRGGGTTGAVRAAAELIAETGDPARAIDAVAREAARRSGDFEERSAKFARGVRGRTLGEALRSANRPINSVGDLSNFPPTNRGALHRLPRVQRLALEMALHESAEQHALDDDLAVLERDWREAEEIAAIVDGELTPLPATVDPPRVK